jgi:hypothetical protein
VFVYFGAHVDRFCEVFGAFGKVVQAVDRRPVAVQSMLVFEVRHAEA